MTRGRILVMGAVAVVLVLPSLLAGNLSSHSSPQNLTWAAQFADQVRAGILYPRWLPDSFDGLGGPAFYFYSPLGFWVDAVLSVATFNVLPVSYRLPVSAALLLWMSGLAMGAWLRGEGASPRAALYGGLTYMAAPYHLVDHYYRGAYAEFAAYTVLPLVMISISRIAGGRRLGVVALACSYAALPMAHLPTSLLVSLTVLPAYALYRAWRLGEPRSAATFFARCLLGAAVGLGLAAIYLVPALMLQDWISAEALWGGSYRVERWFLLAVALRGELTEMMKVIISAAGAYSLAAIGVLVVQAGRGRPLKPPTAAVFWAILCLACLILVAGLFPWFWQLPFVSKVQFSWRLMIVIEFAIVTALCLLSVPLRAMRYFLLAVILVLVPGLAEFEAAIRLRVKASLAQQDVPVDAKEFQPSGYPRKPNEAYDDLNLEPVRGLSTAVCSPQPRLCAASGEPFGALRVEVDADVPTTVVLRRFFFPGWTVEPPLAVEGTRPLRLVSFVVPAGRQTWLVDRTAIAEEKIGWAISGAALIVVLALAALEQRRHRGPD